MNNIYLRVLAMLSLCMMLTLQPRPALAQYTQFTYQGQVTANGTNFSGTGLFQFALATSTNGQQATAIANMNGSSPNEFVATVTVSSGGNGYSTANLPAVAATGGGGSGATFLAQVSAAGVVTGIEVLTPGSGYSSAPTLNVAPPPPDNLTWWSNDGTSVNGSEPSASVSIPVTNGLFTVALGNTALANMAALPVSIFASETNLQLLVWFNDGTHGFGEYPPQNLTPVPYAIYAATSGGTAAGGGGISEVLIPGTSQSAVPNTVYVATNSSTTTITLPTNAPVGSVVQVTGAGSGGWQVVGSVEGQPNFIWNAQPGAQPANWISVACSSNAAYLVALVNGGGVYTSSNGGVTWTPQTTGLPTSANWASVASSADGTHLVAVVYGGGVYTSANGGTNWTPRTTGLPGSGSWISVASSADGARLVAVPNNGQIYTSVDGGVTWTPQAGNSGLPNPGDWASVASSADGSRLVALNSYPSDGGGEAVYTSTNGGTNWNRNSAIEDPNVFKSVASSADGTHLVIATVSVNTANYPDNFYIYTSTNGGTNWTLTSAPVESWESVASSADGSRLFAVATGNGIYSSIDGGATWFQQTIGLPSSASWSSIACSSDGKEAVALIYGGGIYTGVGAVAGGAGFSDQFQYIGNGTWQAIQPVGTWQVSGNTLFYTNGNVGIGTNAPHATLDVNGTVHVGGGLAIDQNGQNSGSVGANALTFGAGASGEGIASQRTPFFTFQDDLEFYTATQNRVEILNNGNVGIGTTSPQALLDVNGTIHVGGGVLGGLTVDEGDQNSGTLSGNAILFGASSGEGIASQRTASGGGNQYDLEIYTGHNNRIEILNNGNVGIGENAPAGALHITGPASQPPPALPGADNGLVLGTTGTSGFKWIQSFGGPLALNPTSNNVGINNTNPAHLLVVGNSGSPAYCDGTSWVNGSDRNAKEDFGAIDPRAVLDKVAAIPITQWRYKIESSGVKHVGPMAQDFHAAFGLNGADDKHIATVDEGGVALAAIQGLNEKVEEKEARIKEQATEIADLKARLDKLERLMAPQKGQGQ